MSKTEKDPVLPEAEEQRLTAVHSYAIAALGFNGWVCSPGAKEDVGMDFWALQQGREHRSVDQITLRRNLAAMRIMQTLAYSIDELRPVVILPEIAEAEDLYRYADEVVENTGLNRLSTNDINILGPAVLCFLKDIEPKTKIEKIVQQARINRGTVTEDVTTIEEIVETMENTPEEETLEDLQVLPNGMLAEVHKIPESPTKKVQTPYYQQYVSSSGGAEAYLTALLEDVSWIHNHFFKF